MKKILAIGLAILATSSICAPLAQAASPTVVGAWKVTFYLEPGRATGATQCVVFKSVPGLVSGVPSSGTWTSPTFPGWAGQWIQVGDHVRWVGITNTLATSESGNMSNYNHFGGVSFNHFLKITAVSSSAGSWKAERVANCSRVTTLVATGDPASSK